MIKETKKEMKTKKEKHYNELFEAVSDELDEKGKRLLSCAKRKVPLPAYLLSPLENMGNLLTSKSLKML